MLFHFQYILPMIQKVHSKVQVIRPLFSFLMHCSSCSSALSQTMRWIFFHLQCTAFGLSFIVMLLV
ncbi:hypothetical protein Patl1_23912 [Pistacia atlantica]|uniref:Uncharacterized protein n=1 Tax=Pistacia atlantica TaxID=434234 RepID=A0ACC1A3J7_9ROSI|nr:hypothetical protein Patl1_23912 [Pistacia atlantica]